MFTDFEEYSTVPAHWNRIRNLRYLARLSYLETKLTTLQSRCASRKDELSPDEEVMRQKWRLPPDLENGQERESQTGRGKVAIVLRTWDDYEYTENRLAWLRALIAEASLERKDKYRVFFLVNIKNADVRLEEDDLVYDKMMHEHVPSEFRDMALLFNQRTLREWYPAIQEHGAQDQMYQALQVFSHQFPEYEYIWQLEMDLRMTSHVHDTLQSATTFAQTQSRRNLWERNGRFFIPALHNNSYVNMTRVVDTEIGETGVWGPVSTREFTPEGPQPPSRSKVDWGIGEEADLINFMPTIDPIGTDWVYESGIHGFAENQATPRRLSIISITRSSRRLLQLISEAQRKRGQWLVSEATLETFALLHGLKAVTVPHPIELHEEIRTEDLNANIHKGPASNKAGGKLPSLLYTNQGWIPGPWLGASYWFTGYGAQNTWDAYVGGKQLPPMLLHPVKEK
ncbi:hypothetical protein E0Z10_g6553 [Xylaria hypoxylon]|uniref:Uncharacterized protein n=1 Tax=Xylaria hypoxylon TaxID=37992 RepID=A0A4Z0YDA0_9PEZI|nr:hypothetical protein E0Z10_g6553 [Xylaria hypoxylon]